MALIWFEGWDSYITNFNVRLPPIEGLVSAGQFPPSVGGGGRFGGNCLGASNFGQTQFLLTSTPSELWWAGAFQTGGTGASVIMGMNSPSGTQWNLLIAFDTNQFTITSGLDGSTLLTGSTTALFVSTWHWIEIRAKLGTTQHSADGEIELWIDNTLVTAQTNVATRTQPGTGGYSSVTILAQSNSGNVLDDTYILDTTGPAPYNTRLGDSRIDSIAPTSDAGPNDGTPSTPGPHWEMFAMNPGYNPADMITLNNVTGQEEVFGIGAAAAASDVWAVNVVYNVQKTNAGNAGVTPEVVIAGTAFEGSVFSPSTSFAFTKSLWTANPAADAPWTAADITAMGIGLITS